MYYVGIDIGSTASKTVVTGDKEIKFVLPTGWSSKETASEIAERLLKDGINVKDGSSSRYRVWTCGGGLCGFCDNGDYVSWKRRKRNGGK